MGLTPATGANGWEAMEYLGEGERPRPILLDPLLPVMDGWQFLAERLKEVRLVAVPVILLAAAGSREACARQAMGVEEVLKNNSVWPGGPGRLPTRGSHRPARAHISACGSSDHGLAARAYTEWTTFVSGSGYRSSRRRN
jgi:CheY-like chemotaxis protein